MNGREPTHPERSNADDDEYQLAPLPETFDEATSPAYRPSAEGASPGTYDVGDEVNDADYSVGAENWKEAAAGVRRNVDEFGLAPELPAGERPVARDAVRRQVERKLAEAQQLRIASPDDPARFTLLNLLLLITLASVVFALARIVPRGVFAGACGGAALFSLFMARWLGQGGAVFQLAWWMLFGIYLLVSILASLGV